MRVGMQSAQEAIAKEAQRVTFEDKGPRPLSANQLATIWPRQFIQDAKMTHMVFGCLPPGGNGCQNCGGRGAMMAFYAKGEPHREWSAAAWHYVEGRGYYAGELVSAECPVCGQGRRAEYLARMSGLSGDDLNVLIGQDHFWPLDGKELASETAVKIAQAQPAGFYTFWGSYGVGKSHLLKGVVNSFRLQGVLSQYARMADILAQVRATFSQQSDHDAGEWLIAQYRQVRVLAVDELDKTNTTPWAMEVIFRLLDYRFGAKESCLTLLASNLPPKGYTGELAYLGSRMTGGRVIEIGGDDLRPVVQ